MNSERLRRQMEFLTEVDKIKQVLRETHLVDGSRKENVAEHSWHIALMASVTIEHSNKNGLNLLRVLKMLLIHDLVEIDVGDTFLYDDYQEEEKYRDEKKAAQRIFNLLPEDQGDEFHELWEEFEAQNTEEAKFAKAIDAFQPLLMAYKNKGIAWKEHRLTKKQVWEKKRHIQEGSEALWTITEYLLNSGLKKGYFIDEK